MKYLFALVMILLPAFSHASPGYDFTCYNREFSASVGFDLEWSTAYVSIGAKEHQLPAASNHSGNDLAFAFENAEYRFHGIAPEGQITKDGTVVANCHQTRESLMNLALYDTPTKGGGWKKYNARGRGSQTVRAAPSVLSEKIDTLPANEPIVILENTGEFLNGYFWYKIAYFGDAKGYIWGALLCTDTDDPELSLTVRKCN